SDYGRPARDRLRKGFEQAAKLPTLAPREPQSVSDPSSVEQAAVDQRVEGVGQASLGVAHEHQVRGTEVWSRPIQNCRDDVGAGPHTEKRPEPQVEESGAFQIGCPRLAAESHAPGFLLAGGWPVAPDVALEGRGKGH